MTKYQKIIQKLLGLCARLWRRLRGTEWKTHPIDNLYRIETSRKASKRELRTGSSLDANNVGYVGLQPSILRACLDLLPITPDWAFIDLGCGKGRALAVATEYPFGQIAGIEFSPILCEIAQSNSRILAALRPSLPVKIILGDATQFDVPPCSAAVLILYNPFDAPLVERAIERAGKHLCARPGLRIFVIYSNPVQHESFDKSDILSRLFAKKIDFSDEERAVAVSSNTYESVLIYQSVNGELLPPFPGANASVKITIPRFGADVIS